MDWDEEILGEMEGGEPNDRFSSYWDDDTEMTYPLILAEIPVKNPWAYWFIFCYWFGYICVCFFAYWFG